MNISSQMDALSLILSLAKLNKMMILQIALSVQQNPYKGVATQLVQLVQQNPYKGVATLQQNPII